MTDIPDAGATASDDASTRDVAAFEPPRSKRVFCNPYLMKLGVVAYGTYLLHFLLIDLVRFLLTYQRERPPAAAFIGADALGVVLAIAIANLSWRRFEKPLVQRGHAYDY